MYLTSNLLSPSSSTKDHTSFAYAPSQEVSSTNAYGFGLQVSLDNLFSNDVTASNIGYRSMAGASESLLASPASADNSYTKHDYCDQTFPGAYNQSNYVTMKTEPHLSIDAQAPSFLYPAMVPPAGSGHIDRDFHTDRDYLLLSYGTNTSQDPFFIETASNYARRNTEPAMSLASPSLATDWDHRQSVLSTINDHPSPSKNEASPNSFFECPVCEKSFAKRHSLKLHMRSHSTEKPFKCSLCEKTFARCHDMKRHEQLHKGVKVFRCQGHLRDGVTKWGCGKKFARSDALTRHLKAGAGRRCLKPLVDESRALDMHPMNHSPTLYIPSLPGASETIDSLPEPYLMIPTLQSSSRTLHY